MKITLKDLREALEDLNKNRDIYSVCDGDGKKDVLLMYTNDAKARIILKGFVDFLEETTVLEIFLKNKE